MPPIKRGWKKRKITLLIPGGWNAIVPQIIEDSLEVFTKAWVEYLYNARIVKDRFKARKLAQSMLQAVFDYAWRVLLSQSIFYWAKEYAKRYPECLVPSPYKNYNECFPGCECNSCKTKQIFILAGFKPEIMQHAFVPNQKPGADGLKFVDSMLREMHDAG